MSIRIDHSAVHLSPRRGNGIHISTPAAQDKMVQFTVGEIWADADVTFRGDPGDSPAGWELGIIQMQFVETNWGYYRGASDRDGSLFMQRGRPPARSQQVCRDTDFFDAIWYDAPPLPATHTLGEWHGEHGWSAARLPAAALPLTLRLHHWNDEPFEEWPLVEANRTTRQNNYLREAQTNLAFCTVLSAREPGGRMHHLAHFYWNLRWQARLTRRPGRDWQVSPSAGTANGKSMSAVFPGAPRDARFAGLMTVTTVPHCNAVALAAANHANRRESPVWSNFDVRD